MLNIKLTIVMGVFYERSMSADLMSAPFEQPNNTESEHIEASLLETFNKIIKILNLTNIIFGIAGVLIFFNFITSLILIFKLFIQ
jgi:hypothetical protein